NKSLVRVVMAAVAFMLCYGGVLWNLSSFWAANSVYSYGFAVPLISGYIVCSRWSHVKMARFAPDYVWGPAFIVGGISILCVGRLGALASLEGISLIPVLAGLVLLLAGRQTLRAVWFPLTYLLLMLPVWSYLFNSLQTPSQEFSAAIA